MKKETDYNIEALRGFCAIMVLLHHCIIFSDRINNGYDLRKTFVSYSPSGHMMVLVFFMLSGYVIGLVYANKQNFTIVDYLKKRLVRLYPIYIFSIIITSVLFSENIKVIIANLFFTQNLLSVTIPYNQSLWSLNHEVVYYLLAIPILKYNINTRKVFPVLLGLLFLSLFVIGFPMIIEGYLVGFIFWLTGFSLSKLKKTRLDLHNTVSLSTNKMLSFFFLTLCWDYLNPFVKLFSLIHVRHGAHVYKYDDMVNFSDAFSYLICIYGIIIFSATKFKWLKLFTIILYGSCFIRLIIVLLNGSFFKTDIFYLPCAFLIIGTTLLFIPKILFKSLSFLAYLGSISYALYVIHTPLLYGIGKITVLSGTTLSYFIRIMALLFTVIALSYLLEKKLQPRLKKYFFKEKNPLPTQQ